MNYTDIIIQVIQQDVAPELLVSGRPVLPLSYAQNTGEPAWLTLPPAEWLP